MTYCYICGSNDIKVPNSKITIFGKCNGKKRQKTVRVCDCCGAWMSNKDITERVSQDECWD